ncbi:extracellular solute-binding protein [Paenibacillus sp. HN-1]|uniref:ABC transporter substrate-binding protein n=1 Tax=Paenibacillus TaxID=44249 RepID=UPI001CA9E858|nr:MULTISPECIES: extracellular solute-binding protein [Paenibacillus]MBY9080726.1 extracellular solute-binding protein [Paenibacillus sp. CGMCC 1.18879]MBY9085282.1 extracellular solute-binding protein [Paenibacillus sinensis]
MRKRTLSSRAFIAIVCLSLFVTACGLGGDHAVSPDKGTEVVTLKMVHWIGTEAGPVVSEINERFHQKYPNITIQVEYAPVDQYQSLIRSRFVAGGAPDLVGIFPGTWKDPFVQAGYLMDLSGSPWESRLQDDALKIMETGGKLYAMPINRNVIGVLYDKQLFRSEGYTIPKSWDEFLALCEKIKHSGVTPLALGIKDQWVTQIIPFAMAASSIYLEDPGFDKELYEGQASFSSSAWKQIFKDYMSLKQKGYFNEGYIGTTYDQMVQMLAKGQAAMMIMGNWSLGPIELTNPKAEIGMFPLPYVQKDEPIGTSSGVSIGIGISSSTSYPEEAQKYLDFWSEPEINALFLERTHSFSVYKDIHPELVPAQREIEPAFQGSTYSFPDQNWPPGVQNTLFQSVQNILTREGEHTIDQALGELDRAYAQNKSKLYYDVP